MSDSAERRFDDPRPEILLNGVAGDELRQGLLSLLIIETTEGLYRCEAGFGNLGSSGAGSDFLYFDRKTFEFGKSLRIALGDQTLFEGRITGIEGRFPSKSPASLVVLAEDRLQDLRMTRRTRSFSDSTDAQVMEQIADQHGLGKRIHLSGASHAHLAQVNQSDLAFLRDRARAVEAELWVSSENGQATLNVSSRSDREAGSPVKLGWRNELQEFTVIADLAGQRTDVTVSGWDVSAKAKLQSQATDSEIAGELQGGESGASILQSLFGTRRETLCHSVPWDSQEAEQRVKAYFRMQARRFIVGHGVARTTAKLRVGTYVDLDGLGPLFTGKYYLAAVRHRFDGVRGLRSELCVERPGLGRP